MRRYSEAVIHEGIPCTRTIFYSEADRAGFLRHDGMIAAPASMLLTRDPLPRDPSQITPRGYSMLILAGGRSRRMGTDKTFLRYYGTTLIELQRSKARLLGTDDLILAGNERVVSGCRSVTDPIRDAGPLAGLAAGLMAAANPICTVIPVDMPGVYPELMDSLAARLSASGADAVIACCAGRIQPLVAAYRTDLAYKLTEHLRAGERSVRSFLDVITTEILPLPASCEETFLNLNTPGDLPAGEA